MEFNPKNHGVKLCLLGLAAEETGQGEAAEKLFFQAWNESNSPLEKFHAAYFLGRIQTEISARLKWFSTALQIAQEINDDSVRSAFPTLYTAVAKSCEELGDTTKAKVNFALAESFEFSILDTGLFYHGTKAGLHVGDLLTPGHDSNYKPELKMNHVYFTGLVNGAGLAAELAPGDNPPRVYIVEPTGPFENDPNVTNKKFPGNPTRSYRSGAPLRVIGEVTHWPRLTREELRQWREKLAVNKGEIVN